MNIFENSESITIKFYLKQHWYGRKAAERLLANQIIALVSMATDSSHRAIMGKMLWLFYYYFSAFIFEWVFYILAGKDDHGSKFNQIRTQTTELTALYAEITLRKTVGR